VRRAVGVYSRKIVRLITDCRPPKLRFRERSAPAPRIAERHGSFDRSAFRGRPEEGHRLSWLTAESRKLTAAPEEARLMGDSNVVVETRKLTKIYRDFWGRQKKRALNALNLQILRGEIFGLLGPNGSGKTTTIKLLLGLLFPTDGEAYVFGQPAAEVRKNERIGYLPEESYLYRFLNAEETLDF